MRHVVFCMPGSMPDTWILVAWLQSSCPLAYFSRPLPGRLVLALDLHCVPCHQTWCSALQHDTEMSYTQQYSSQSCCFLNAAGALHTHKSIRTQIQGLCEAWDWQKEDRILHALPLHHVHGIINALYCAHYSGACVEFLPKFSPGAVWDKLKVITARAFSYSSLLYMVQVVIV